jgi:cell division protein FtsB
MINRSAWSGRLSLPQGSVQRFGSLRSWLQLATAIAATGLLTFVLYLYVLPNSQMSEARARIAQLQADAAALVRANAELERQISRYTYLPDVAARARELGMRPPPSYVFFQRDAGASSPATATSPEQPSSTTGSTVSGTSWREPINLMRERVAEITRPWLEKLDELTSRE